MSTTLGWPLTQPTLAVGPGVCLRPFTAHDVDAIYDAHQDPEHLRWVPVRQPYTRESAERFALGVSTEMWAEESGCVFAIADPRTGDLLGSVGVPFIDHAAGQAEIGYWVVPAARGRGIATASLRAVSDWLFDTLGLTTLTLHIEPDNPASLAVARGAGFEQVPGDMTFDVLGHDRTFCEWRRERVVSMVTAEPDWLSGETGRPRHASDATRTH